MPMFYYSSLFPGIDKRALSANTHTNILHTFANSISSMYLLPPLKGDFFVVKRSIVWLFLAIHFPQNLFRICRVDQGLVLGPQNGRCKSMFSREIVRLAHTVCAKAVSMVSTVPLEKDTEVYTVAEWSLVEGRSYHGNPVEEQKCTKGNKKFAISVLRHTKHSTWRQHKAKRKQTKSSPAADEDTLI